MKIFFNILVMYVTILPVMARGQMIVSDPTMAGLTAANKATFAQQLHQAAQQTAQLKESYDQLKKNSEVFYKVSNTLRNAAMVQNILAGQTNLIYACGKALKNAREVKNPNTELLTQLQSNINAVIEGNRQNLNLLKQAMEEGIFKMSDGERIKLLLEIQDRTEQAMKKANSYQTAYEGTARMINFVKKNL